MRAGIISICPCHSYNDSTEILIQTVSTAFRQFTIKSVGTLDISYVIHVRLSDVSMHISSKEDDYLFAMIGYHDKRSVTSSSLVIWNVRVEDDSV